MSQINSNTKDDFQVVLLLSCFVGHPVRCIAALHNRILWGFHHLQNVFLYRIVKFHNKGFYDAKLFAINCRQTRIYTGRLEYTLADSNIHWQNRIYTGRLVYTLADSNIHWQTRIYTDRLEYTQADSNIHL